MRRHRVVVLVRHGVLPLELGIAHQLFGAARTPSGERLYDVRTCALRAGDVRTDADFTVHVDRDATELRRADTVVLPASHEEDELTSDGLDAELADALARIPARVRIASICTGSFVLAAAGLLDGRRATTHWESAAHFRAAFPRVELVPDVLYTDEGNVLTAAGEASGIDLCLHMIRNDHGAAVAAAVARTCVVPPHRDGGQAQYIRTPVVEPSQSSTRAARAWALEHLDRPLSLRELADCESMSVRTFTRRFREEVGSSPGRWITAQRLALARELLEESDLPVDRIALRTGFGTGTALRQQLHAALGVSPSAYRRTFRGSDG